MPTARVILNPTSGSGRGQRMAERILVGLDRRGVDTTVVATTAPREAARLGREAARSGVDLVVAAGGDGTVHEVSNGLLNGLSEGVEGPVLGILPVGTGNDFAKLVGPLDDLERSLDILVEGELRRLDACTAAWNGSTHWFVNAAGTGLDVDVVRRLLKKRGGATPAVAKYLGAVLKSLVRYEAIPLRIRMDHRVVEQEVTIVVAGNGQCVGGGFWVCPAAEPDDGRFDICIIERVSFVGALGPLLKVMRGKHEGHPKVKMYQAREVEIEAMGPDPLFFQLDGELHEPPSARSLTLRVHPGALPVMTEGKGG